MVAVLSRLLSVRNPLVLGENERVFSSFLAFPVNFLLFLHSLWILLLFALQALKCLHSYRFLPSKTLRNRILLGFCPFWVGSGGLAGLNCSRALAEERGAPGPASRVLPECTGITLIGARSRECHLLALRAGSLFSGCFWFSSPPSHRASVLAALHELCCVAH
jgi:hypothetical protein